MMTVLFALAGEVGHSGAVGDAAGHAAVNPLAPDYVTMGVTLVVFGALLAILYLSLIHI